MTTKDEAIFDELADELGKKLIAEGKLIEAGFRSLMLVVFPEVTNAEQIDTLRCTFFGGAQHLFSTLMRVLDADREPTEADDQKMLNISNELQTFALEVMSRLESSSDTPGTAPKPH